MDSDEIVFIEKIDNKLKCGGCNELFDTNHDLENHIKMDCSHNIFYDKIYTYDEKKLGSNIFKGINSGDVYIVSATDNKNAEYYKIGISTQLKSRLESYDTCNMYTYHLHCYFPCKNVRVFDGIMKQKLKSFNVKREIYEGDLDSIKKIIKTALKKHNGKGGVHEYMANLKMGEITECTTCDKIFYNKIDFNKHMKVHDISDNKNDNKPNIDKNDSKIHNIKGEGNIFLCNFCTNTFNLKSSLSNHIKRCKEKKVLLDRHEDQIIKLVDDHKKQIEDMDTKYKKQIKDMDTKYKKQINEYNHKIELLEVKLDYANLLIGKNLK